MTDTEILDWLESNGESICLVPSPCWDQTAAIGTSESIMFLGVMLEWNDANSVTKKTLGKNLRHCVKMAAIERANG